MYAIYYRTGGTENFKWNRASNVQTVEQAIQSIQELNRMGYPARYAKAALVNAIGLPETYIASCYPSDD